MVIYDVEEPAFVPRVSALLAYPPGLGSYQMAIDAEAVGSFYLRRQDSRERLFFLNHSVQFKGAEKITIHTGPTGMNLTQDILFLHTRPPIRKRTLEIRHVGAEYAEVDGEPRFRLTWVPTCVPAECGDWG